MPDVLTSVFGLVKQTIGGNRNTWGGILNANLDVIEAALAGKLSEAVTGGSVTLSDAERRNRILVFSGTLAADQAVVVGNFPSTWLVQNATTGAFALSMKTAAGTAVAIPQGGWCKVWCDGADIVYAGPSTTLFSVLMKVADAGYSFVNEVTSGFYRISAGRLGIKILGTKIIDVQAAGVAVTGTLDVSGDMTCSNLAAGGLVTQAGATIVPIGASSGYDGIHEPSGWKFKNGQALSRTTYAALLAALTATAGATRDGTAVLNSVDTDLTGLGLEGAKIEGSAGVPSNTTIVSLTSNSITLSQAATGAGAITIRILPHGNGDGSTTFNVPDDRGRSDVGRDNMGGTSANRLTGQSGGLDGDKLGTAGGGETVTLVEAQIPVITPTGTISPSSFQAGKLVGFSAPSSFGQPAALVDDSVKNLTFTGTAFGGGGAHNNVQPSRVTNKIIFTGVF